VLCNYLSHNNGLADRGWLQTKLTRRAWGSWGSCKPQQQQQEQQQQRQQVATVEQASAVQFQAQVSMFCDLLDFASQPNKLKCRVVAASSRAPIPGPAMC